MERNQKPESNSITTQTACQGESIEMNLKNEEIRELRSHNVSLLQDNALLRAQVQESEYWIYNRGPVAEELQQLRQQTSLQIQEINRLTLENTRIMDDLRRADSIVVGAGSRHQEHPVGHPPQERSSITQTYVNSLFQRSRESGRRNENQHL